MPEHVLRGCRPVPLAHYLKALGVLRLVAEQKDPSVRGYWRRDRFVLRTELDRETIERFFLEEYRPTPIVAPWNGGSGFYPKDNNRPLDAFAGSTATRFAEYRETIQRARSVLRELTITDKQTGEKKAELLERCRAEFPDHSLQWLDATYALLAEGPKYPPLLGTGGNDGRLDFTNNFMQRLLSLFDPNTAEPCPIARALLEAALFENPTNELFQGAPIGQFLPNQAGGPNGGTGFSTGSLINPWDFVLMLEGATAFAATIVRKTEQNGRSAASFPFTVRTTAVGYASAAGGDESSSSSRAEIWLPLWSRPASARESLALLAEGRARVGNRTAENGVDFVRAVVGLGVDRGIESFQRYGFQLRNGRSYLAVPTGRFMVRAQQRTTLLSEVDAWLGRFRGKATNATAPASAGRASRQLEAAIFELCRHADSLRLQQVLMALGRCEQVMAASARWTAESYLKPVPALSPDWLRQADDGSVELRLAAALASVLGHYGSEEGKRTFLPLRRQLEPVHTWRGETGLGVRWDSEASRDVAWTAGHLADVLNAVLARRLVLAVRAGARTYPDLGVLAASLGDIADFIEGRVDDRRLADLLWGCILLDWSRVERGHGPRRRHPDTAALPGAFHALLKLCFAGPSMRPRARGDADVNRREAQTTDVPITPEIHRLAAAGRGAEASRQAIRRLRGSGIVPAVTPFEVGSRAAVRTAAALLFPVSTRDRELLARIIARPEQADASNEPEQITTHSGASP